MARYLYAFLILAGFALLANQAHATLTHQWAFDIDGEGPAVAKDTVGGVNFMIQGTQVRPSGAGGVDGYCHHFDWDNDQLYNLGTTLGPGGNTWTMAAWIQCETSTGNIQIIMNKGWFANGDWSLYLDSSGQPCFYSNETGGITGAGQYLIDNRWHHVAVTYNGSATPSWTIYVDGQSVTTANKTGGTQTNPSRRVTIGCSAYTADNRYPDYYFVGNLDDIRMYDNCMTGSEIGTLYADGCRLWPTGRWSFDVNAGDAMHDASGNEQNGLLYNYPTWVPFRNGSALSFNGSNNWMNVASATTLNGYYGLSIAGWIRAGANGNYRVVLAKGAKNTGHYEVYLTPGGELRFYAPDLTNSDMGSGVNIADYTWRHFAVVYNPGQNVKFYINGTLVNTVGATGNIAVETEQFRIGALCDNGFPFLGMLDDIRIYKTVLSGTDVANLASTTGEPTGRWKLADDARDCTIGGRDGSLSGGPVYVARGRGDQSTLSFDGVDDCMDVGSCSLNLGNSFTLASWVKAPDTNGNIGVFMAKNTKTTGHFEQYLNTDGEWRFYAPNLTNSDMGSGVKVDYNHWHHLAITYNGSTVKFYDDGELVKSVGATGTVASATATFRLGKLVEGSLPFKGQLSDARIYQRVLSDTEVANLSVNQIDLDSDTWSATDGLDRELPGNSVCGNPQTNRTGAIIYCVWHAFGFTGPYNNVPILRGQASWGPRYEYHWWDEPEANFFMSEDDWYIRRSMSMLTDAGIDVIVLDATNSFIYPEECRTLFRVLTSMRNEGMRTPQIMWHTQSSSDATVTAIYNYYYAPNYNPELWFKWDGKPLIFGDGGAGVAQHIKDCFTWRKCWSRTAGQDIWPLYDDYPQDYGWHVNSSTPEAVSVSVSANTGDNKGRSFRNGSQPAPDGWWECPSTQAYGYHYDEQWTRALSLSPQPKFVYNTAWNGWHSQRFIAPEGGQYGWFMGHYLQYNETYFVDSCSREYSQDIEPVKDGFTDNYYYQMVEHMRRYKGVNKLETPSAFKTIAIDGSFSDWLDVTPRFKDTRGDTFQRDFFGFGNTGVFYTNTTGRNDIIESKVACDSTYVYIYVKTAAALTTYTGNNWMRLLIDSDCNHATGYEGYDYIINDTINSSISTTIKANSGGTWSWGSSTSISYAYAGNELEIRIPRSTIGQGSGSNRVHFRFKIADNFTNNNLMDMCVNGDTAPNRRFAYEYDTTP